MIIALLVLACVALYYIGGQKWAHTLFRDVGCSICITAIAALLLGWHWSMFLGFLVMWAGFTIGDHEIFYWTPHALAVALGMLPYTIVMCAWLPFILMIVVVVGGTYLVSRFWNAWGVDVICRGLLYATIPLYFLLNMLH